MIPAILGLSSLIFFGTAASGFRSGVMYGQASDVTREKNPKIFKFVGLGYWAIGVMCLIAAVLSGLP
jgi:hypothetical protein